MSDSPGQEPCAPFPDRAQPRCPCVLLLDTSASMSGRPIDELNAGLRTFAGELRRDPLALQCVEVAVISFGPVRVDCDLTQAADFDPTPHRASGNTPVGEALLRGMTLLRARRSACTASGIALQRPWMLLITDGAPTDKWTLAAAAIREEEARKDLVFHAVGVRGADMDTLSEISVREPLRLEDLEFRALFHWLSHSLGTAFREGPGDPMPPPRPTAPGSWGIA